MSFVRFVVNRKPLLSTEKGEHIWPPLKTSAATHTYRSAHPDREPGPLIGRDFLLSVRRRGGFLTTDQVALVVATMVAVFVAWRRGHTLDSLREAAVASVGSGLGAIFILLAVGSLIGTWAMSGTLGAMVYYGLQLLSPNYFYMTACLICAIISASIGTSWTTVGTIGIGLVGIAVSMDLNPAIAAAAVISGAYVGDTSSPLSDSANLAAAAAEVDLYEHIRETAVTTGLALIVSLVVFFMLGQPGAFDASEKIRQPCRTSFSPPCCCLCRSWSCSLSRFSSFRRSPRSSSVRSRRRAARRHPRAGAGYCVRRCRRRDSAAVPAPEGRVARSGKRIQV